MWLAAQFLALCLTGTFRHSKIPCFGRINFYHSSKASKVSPQKGDLDTKSRGDNKSHLEEFNPALRPKKEIIISAFNYNRDI